MRLWPCHPAVPGALNSPGSQWLPGEAHGVLLVEQIRELKLNKGQDPPQSHPAGKHQLWELARICYPHVLPASKAEKAPAEVTVPLQGSALCAIISGGTHGAPRMLTNPAYRDSA